MTMHGIEVCQHGVIHRQCRCPNPTEIRVVCDNSSEHAHVVLTYGKHTAEPMGIVWPEFPPPYPPGEHRRNSYDQR